MRFFALSLCLNLLLLALPIASFSPTSTKAKENLKISVEFHTAPKEAPKEAPKVAESGNKVEKVEKVAEKSTKPAKQIKKQPAATKPAKSANKVKKAPESANKVEKAAKSANSAESGNKTKKPAESGNKPAESAKSAELFPDSVAPVSAPVSAPVTSNQDPSFCAANVSCEMLKDAYPRKAKQLGMYGKYAVDISFRVDAGGVQDARASGNMIFRQAALTALKSRRCVLKDPRAAGCRFEQRIIYELKR